MEEGQSGGDAKTPDALKPLQRRVNPRAIHVSARIKSNSDTM